ncbi:MAG: hypothetical protein PHV06_00600 [bacterium]|nr:hypothetical protein [bacterium]
MNVKGLAIKSSIDLIHDKFGNEGVKRVLNELTEEEKGYFEFGICKSIWYPYSLFIHITRIIIDLYGNGDDEYASELGAFTAEHDRSTIMSFFYKLGTPKVILRLGLWAFKRYYDESEIVLTDTTIGNLVFEMKSFSEMDELHLKRVRGYLQRGTELAGGKNARSRYEVTKKDGKKVVVFTTTWE